MLAKIVVEIEIRSTDLAVEVEPYGPYQSCFLVCGQRSCGSPLHLSACVVCDTMLLEHVHVDLLWSVHVYRYSSMYMCMAFRCEKHNRAQQHQCYKY
jgi:hypothetical protein